MNEQDDTSTPPHPPRPPLPSEEDWNRIVDVLSGRATAEECADLEARAASDEELRSALEGARLAWERAGHVLRTAVTTSDLDQAWARVERAMQGAPVRSPAAAARVLPLRRYQRPRSRWRVAALAASVILAIGLGATWMSWRGPAISPVAMEEITAASGRPVSLTLSDGSQITLAPNSRLRTPERFAHDSRVVELVGRAYFHVTHDPARPFLVHAGSVETRVLGTEFGVEAYPDDSAIEVVVRSGSVAVRRAAGSSPSRVVLTRGQRAIVDSAGSIEVESGIDADARLSWTSGRLTFDQAPLSDVLAEVERWYGIRVELRDPTMGRRRLTATFQSEPPYTVVQIIAELVDALEVRDGGRTILAPRQ